MGGYCEIKASYLSNYIVMSSLTTQNTKKRTTPNENLIWDPEIVWFQDVFVFFGGEFGKCSLQFQVPSLLDSHFFRLAGNSAI